MKIIPNYPNFLNNKAYALEEMKKYDEELKYYNETLKFNPYDKQLQEDRDEFLKKI